MRWPILLLLLLFSCIGPALTNGQIITVDVSITQSVYPHHERDAGKFYHLRGPGDISFIQGLGRQFERMFWAPDITTVSPGVYNYNVSNIFSADVPTLDQQASYGAAPVLVVSTVPTWLADKSYSGGVYNSEDPPNDFAAYQQILYDGFAFWKTRYPNFQYVEVWNEPDGNWTGKVNIPIALYERIYSTMVAAVRAANALGLPGPPIKIGGPTAYYFDASYITSLMDYAKANGLPLDFISWHEYANAATPSSLQGDVQKVQSWLASRGMSAQTFVTEWTDGDTDTTLSAGNSAQTAAFIAAGNYYFSLAGNSHNFIFGQLESNVPHSSLLDYSANGRHTVTGE